MRPQENLPWHRAWAAGMTGLRQCFLAGCGVWLMALHGLSLAQPTEQDALDALDGVQTLIYQDRSRAREELRAQAQSWEASPFPAVRRTYLSTLIGLAFEAGDLDQVQAATDRLLALSQGTGDDKGFALAHTAQAHRLGIQGKASEALLLLDRVESVAMRSSDPEVLWTLHLVRGNLQNTTGRFELALDSILKSMDFAQRRPRQAQVSRLRSLVNLGLIYMSMKNVDKSLRAIEDAQVIARQLGATQILGTLHLNRGNVESGRGRSAAALAAYQAALQIGDASKLFWLQAAALNNLGDFHLIRKEYALAEPFERRALAKYQEAGDEVGAALSRSNIGFALMGQGRIDEGLDEVKAGLQFLRNAGARTTEELILEELSRMYEQVGMFREALETARAQQALVKELLRADREQAVAALQAQFDSVQRERQIDLLAQENRLKDIEIAERHQQLAAAAIGATVLVVAGGFILVLYRRTRHANSELQEAKQLADEALQDKSLFLATASHDLRQPVHAMSMLVEAIALRNHDEAIVPLVVDLRSSMKAMNQLFNALLDLSRLEAGGLTASPVPVDLQQMVRDVVRMFREQATTSGLALRLHVPRRGAFVTTDPLLLRQALANLTNNAIRYTPKGRVLIGVRPRRGDWMIEVWDTGIGISTGEEQQVFSPYFRSQHAWRRDGSGHGLGLAVVARCAQTMGATYGFQSCLGKGSRFWLRLAASPAPCEKDALPVERPKSADLEPLEPLQGRCLVLDDDPQVLKAWQAMMDGWGIDLRTATNAAEAMAHLEAGFAPSAIFCDQRLRSGESGFDILRELLARCPQASGAMVSGELRSQELDAAENEGYLVLRKPLEPASLHAILGHWLNRPAPSDIEREHR
jgi:signal transduction histidine kinase/CheY-like chemotaxis protein